MQSLEHDVAAAHGVLTALQARKRRIQAGLPEARRFRWSYMRLEREILFIEARMCRALMGKDW